MPESLSEARLSELFSLRRYCVLYRDEANNHIQYKHWQDRIEKIDNELKTNGVLP